MNKAIIWLAIVSIFLVGCNKKEVTQIIENDSTSLPSVQQDVVENQTVLSANYETYDEWSLWEAENTILFFHASWCGSCKKTHDSLSETGLPDNVKVLKVDFDTAMDLKKKYEIVKEHTFVQVDKNGEMIKKWSGSFTAEDILDNVGSSEDAMMKKDDEKMMKEEGVMMEKKEDEKMMKEEAAKKQVIAAGTFANYTPELVGHSEDTVIFFHASWCPSCVALEKTITSGTVPVGLTILKADFDSETDLRKKYGVVSQHTLVQVDSEGNEIKKWAGWNTIESIVEKLN